MGRPRSMRYASKSALMALNKVRSALDEERAVSGPGDVPLVPELRERAAPFLGKLIHHDPSIRLILSV